jgi:hypothetical protein
VGQSSRIIAKGIRDSTRAGRSARPPNLRLAGVARGRSQMDLIFWVLAGLIIYFLFFKPPG